MIKKLWAVRAGSVAVAATLALATAGVPAEAADITFTTTGASGRAIYVGNGNYSMRATDTLTDGHCAQYQRRQPGGSWSWFGESSCSGVEEYVGNGYFGYEFRLCRTGVVNCSTGKLL